MSKAPKLAPTHQRIVHEAGEVAEKVKATQWRKDGDHPDVERYPIEKREYKGLLRAGTVKLALRFGDWICEDEKGRVYLVEPTRFAAQYEQIGG